jgi:hypothetical protein
MVDLRSHNPDSLDGQLSTNKCNLFKAITGKFQYDGNNINNKNNLLFPPDLCIGEK